MAQNIILRLKKCKHLKKKLQKSYQLMKNIVQIVKKLEKRTKNGDYSFSGYNIQK